MRKRRLSNALALIKASALPLAQIALECGYSSQQALCRAVRSAVRTTPTAYRRGGEYYFFPPFSGDAKHQITVSIEAIPGTLCAKFYQRTPAGIEDNAIKRLLCAVPGFCGRVFGRGGARRGADCCYELHLTDAGDALEALKAGGFFISGAQPPHTALFASTAVRDDEAAIQAAWNYLYADWLAANMFERTGEAFFEEYLIKAGKCRKLRLYLPIQKRGDCAAIKLERLRGMRFFVSRACGANAEEDAARALVGALAARYPHVLKGARRFFVQRGANDCACGIAADLDIPAMRDADIERLDFPAGLYAVLYSDVAGECTRFSKTLFSWARDNGVRAREEAAFALYDVRDGWDAPKLALYCPVKSVQNDNTRAAARPTIEARHREKEF